MSLLSTFSATCFGLSRTIIGTEAISIGAGNAILAVVNESDIERDYELGGFGESKTLALVVSSAEFLTAYPAAQSSYLGKIATAMSATWRVKRISMGGNTTTIDLISTSDTA